MFSILTPDSTQFLFQSSVYIFTEGSGPQEFCVSSSLRIEGRAMTAMVFDRNLTAQGNWLLHNIVVVVVGGGS